MLKMIKHTPEPWKTEIWADWVSIIDQENHLIADVYAPGGEDEDEAVIEALANANLFVAAPDLLDALKEIFYLLEEHQPVWYLRKHYTHIMAAIARAEGRNPGGNS